MNLRRLSAVVARQPPSRFKSKKRVSPNGGCCHVVPECQSEAQAMAALLGPFTVLTFCISRAFRDVYFANIFQGVDFFAVIAIAFGLSAVIFGLLTAARSAGDFSKLGNHVGTVAAMNITTALAWTCYFFGLKHIEPSIVNTVHSGMAPLTVVALAAVGVRLTKAEVIGRGEYACYAWLALCLLGLWWVVLSGHSGLHGQDVESSLLGLVLLLVSGSSITISLLYSKRLHDHGVSAEGVTAVRYLLIIPVAASIEISNGWPQGLSTSSQLAMISVAATLLIVLPTFALQIGVAHTASFDCAGDQGARAGVRLCTGAIRPQADVFLADVGVHHRLFNICHSSEYRAWLARQTSGDDRHAGHLRGRSPVIGDRPQAAPHSSASQLHTI